MGDETDVLYEVKDGAAWLTINREERRNALRARTVEELRDGLCRASADEAVRVICITGAGRRAFCAGADLGGAEAVGPKGAGMGLQAYAALLKDFAASHKPIVGRVAGHCVGGGLGLMLSCDMVYAAEHAKIGTPEVNVGLFPMMVAALLPRHTSRKKVLEMIFTGQLVSARVAEQMGLVTRVCEADALDQVVKEVLASVASKAPLALSVGRRAFHASEEMNLAAGLDYLCGQLEVLTKSEDAAEGVLAFQEKRAPSWKGH